MTKHALAAPELAAVEVHGMSRHAFLTRAALAAGAVYGVGAIGPFVSQALGQEATGDLDVLNFALTLEQMESNFYDQALRRAPLDRETRDLTEEIAKNEGEHAAALKSVIESLGGKPVRPPKVDFGGTFSSQDKYLAVAQKFEDGGVAAYNGAGPRLESKEALLAAGTIVQTEARQAALVRMLRNEKPAPQAFDEAFDQPKIRRIVSPYIER